MIGGGRQTMPEPIPGEPNLPSPLRVPGTFEGFEFSDTFFGSSDGRCHRSRESMSNKPHCCDSLVTIFMHGLPKGRSEFSSSLTVSLAMSLASGVSSRN
ncbi:hypothetical protein L3X38_015608 [Prunus dulcis]|uniref:Uncharacterized protein n=1 Tax=Prunus dulcis TaxID=3755 RepID=A0AAD4W4E6_PRUDU|nr:hypothetical protein L3X38_015608 [Prunus dulcis]